MVRKVDLDEKEHALNILRRLDRMKRDQRHCDFIVSVDGNKFHTHRNILSAGSDYFDAMLTHDTKESQFGKVEMMDVDSECVGICLNYIYTGKAEIPDGRIEELMHVTNLMQLDNLFEGLVAVLEDDLDINTYYRTKEIAKLYGQENLLAKCKEFTDENLGLISAQPEFLDEHKKSVLGAIMSENLLASEEERLIVSLRWTRHAPDRAGDLPDFLNYVNLKQISAKYLRHLLENESLITNNPNLFQVFSISLMDSLRIQTLNKEDFCGKTVVIIFDKNSDWQYYFNVEDEEVKTFHNESIRRFGAFSAICLDSQIYVLSRDKCVHRLKFQDENPEWERVENMMEDHGLWPPAVSHNGYIYVMGGGGNGRCTAAVEQYFPLDNEWVQLGNMPLASEKATLVTFGEYIYSAGGFRNGTCLDTFSRFSPCESEWIDLPPMTRPKRNCGATAANNKIYILGGHDGKYILTEVDSFDVSTSQWTSLAPMIERRSLLQAFHINGLIYVVGGYDGKIWKLIEKYDIEKDVWTKVNIQCSDDFTIHRSVTI